MRLAELSGKRVVVWGTGREARSVIDTMKRLRIDAEVIAIDDALEGPDKLGDIEVARGAHATDALDRADVIVRSPGVSPYRPDVMMLIAAGKKFTTATDLWLSEGFSNVIGVTGTKGKSTTSSLIACFLRAISAEVVLAGNIGRSALDVLGVETPDWWVVEFSSFQATGLTRSPSIGALTSLSPEHLDWHGNAQAYVRDKLSLFSHDAEAAVVVNAYDPGVREHMSSVGGQVVSVGEAPQVRIDNGSFAFGDDVLFGTDACMLPGEHNKALVCVALQVLAAAGIELVAHASVLRAALETFEGLPHRLSPVGEVNGVTYVDDSIATTPIATIAALEAYPDRPITLIVGGHDRGVPYEDFGAYIAARSRISVIAVPESGTRIADCIRASGGNNVLAEISSLEDAVDRAASVTPSGGAVLLSPAAPSFGQFKDYIDRADHFIGAVKRL